MKKQINIRLDEKLIKQIARHISKSKPKYRNDTHFFEIAVTELIKKDGGF